MPKSILVIDDDPAILRFLNFHLKKAGYSVFESSGAVQAMDVLWKEKIDLIITDMHMPNQDGFEVVSALKLKHAKIPIVVISADPKNDRIHNALRYSGVTFIPKPFEVEELLKILAQQLEIEDNPHSQT